MFRSSWPRANIHAVTPLIAMPISATHATVAAATGAGVRNRSTASSAIAPTPTSSTAALISAARMEPRPQP